MSDTRYGNVVRAFASKPWAIMPSKLEEIAELIRLRATGVELSKEEIQARVGASSSTGAGARVRGIQVIPIQGTISPRANLFSEFSGGTSIESLRSQFEEAMRDDDVSAILFDVDSPGGAVDLVPELARDIRAARGTKPIVAVANTLMASAAYYLGAQADEVFATPSGDVGSIGVFAVHEDFSKMLEQDGVKVSLITAGKYKAEASPYEPLGEEARSHIQELVDSSYEMFTEDVAAARGVSAEAVRTGFGEGRVLHAKAALREGLIDGVQTFDQTVRSLLATGGATGGASAMTARASDAELLDQATARTVEVVIQADTKSFADAIDEALRALDDVVTDAEALRALSAPKREKLSEIASRARDLVAACEETEEELAKEETAEASENFDADAILAEAGARIRLQRGG